MLSLEIAGKIIPTIFVALFPLINPIGSALVLYGMTGKVDERTWIAASRRIALNTFLLLTFFYLFGSYILKLFGISIAVVQFAGGMVVASIGWNLLNPKEDDKQAEGAKHDTGATLEDKLFYPYTFPITVGPGGLAVALTFSAHLDRHPGVIVTEERIAAIIGIFAICLVTSACYARLKFLTERISPAGALAISRILAFFVFCIGVEIALSGWRALNP